MKKYLIKVLLGFLNSNWLNGTPTKYEFVGNITAFSRGYLESLVMQEPHLMVRDLLRYSLTNCPDYPHTHENGEIRPMNEQDGKDLQNFYPHPTGTLLGGNGEKR